MGLGDEIINPHPWDDPGLDISSALGLYIHCETASLALNFGAVLGIPGIGEHGLSSKTGFLAPEATSNDSADSGASVQVNTARPTEGLSLGPCAPILQVHDPRHCRVWTRKATPTPPGLGDESFLQDYPILPVQRIFVSQIHHSPL